MTEALLLVEDKSKLKTEGGLPPDTERAEPRAGGGVGPGDVNGVFEDPRTAPGRRKGGGGGILMLSMEGLRFSCHAVSPSSRGRYSH